MPTKELTCPNCGEELEKRWQYCPICGMDLAEAKAAPHPRTGYKTEAGRLAEYAELYGSAQETLEAADGDLEGALFECEAAIELNPTAAEAHNLRGLILDLLDRPNEAIQAYREALRLDPNFEEARANLTDSEQEQRESPNQMIGADDPEQKNFGWWKLVLLALILLILAGLFFQSGQLLNSIGSILGPTTSLTFEPDRSKITDVDRAALEKTAQILTERCEFLGCKGVKFAVTDQGQIVGKIPSYLNLDVETLARRISAIGLIEFTDFGTSPFPEGTAILTDFVHPFFPQQDGKTWHTIMTNAEIESAKVMQDQIGQYGIDFKLTEKGRNIFFEHTSENINKYLGIVMDKVVISSPQINSAIPGGEGTITGQFTEDTAKKLAAYLNVAPLPIPLVIVENPGQ